MTTGTQGQRPSCRFRPLHSRAAFSDRCSPDSESPIGERAVPPSSGHGLRPCREHRTIRAAFVSDEDQLADPGASASERRRASASGNRRSGATSSRIRRWAAVTCEGRIAVCSHEEKNRQYRANRSNVIGGSRFRGGLSRSVADITVALDVGTPASCYQSAPFQRDRDVKFEVDPAADVSREPIRWALVLICDASQRLASSHPSDPGSHGDGR